VSGGVSGCSGSGWGYLFAYQEEGPWDVVVLEMELVDEEYQDTGDDEGGE